MARKINIQKTFEAIRQLPLEVSMQQVELWVRQRPFKSPGLLERVKWHFTNWFNN